MQKDKINILIVDDSEFSRRTMAQILTQDGYSVVGAVGNAKDAINTISTHHCHILIIDVVMPDMNGIELAERLMEKFTNIYVIIVSSLAMEHIVIESIAAGAGDFIQKPFEKEALLDSVGRISKQISNES